MAFGVSPQVPHEALGKGLHGLKVEAMATGPQRSFWTGGLSGRALAESILLGVFTLTLAALPVLVTRVPAPESLLSVLELLQDWCTPSICFVVLIVGVLVATSGVWGVDAESLTTPEQNHKTFTEAAAGYLTTPGPVAATQIDPLRMPDIFFSAEAACAQQSAFPVGRVAAQPTSVLVPVYYPALVPPPGSREEEVRDLQGERFGGPRHFESKGVGEIFEEDRFVGDRFSPRLEERFSPERFLVSTDEVRFGPRGVEVRFSPEKFMNPQAEELYVPEAQDMYLPHAEAMFVPPKGQEDLFAKAEDRYVPPMHEMYPEVQDGYESQAQDSRFEVEQEKFDLEDESPGSTDSSRGRRYDPPHVESPTRPDDDETRSSESESEDEAVNLLPPAAVEQDFELEDVESESEEMEPQVQLQPEVDLDPQESSSSSFEHVSPSALPPAPELPPSPSPRSTSSASAPGKPPLPAPPAPQPSNSLPDPATTRPSVLSPRTPPRHSASGRPPLSSSSSRSYAEFVRRTSTFAPRISVETPPKTPPPDPVKPVEPVEPAKPVELAELFPKGRRTNSSPLPVDSSAVTKQVSMPAQGRRPREVMVVDDDQLDKALETQGLGEEDDVDERVEAFLKHSREQLRLQRQESLQRHRRAR